MIKAVILDLDDTLFMSFDAAFVVVNMILREMDAQPLARETLAKHWGKPVHQAAKDWNLSVNPAVFATRFVAHFPAAVQDGVFDILTPQNLAALRELQKSGKMLFVLTSRVQGELAHLLDPRHELSALIKKFYYKDTMRYHKPDPRAFKLIEEEQHIAPDECVYVGDSIGDAVAATGAGLHFVACLESGLHTKNDFKPHPVSAFINSFHKIVDVVIQLDK
jgi:phosphoglycolate phosphatase